MRAPTERFSDRVADYVRYRPSYPSGIVDLIVQKAGIGPDSTIADVGCGTGIFTALLLQTKGKVVGLEPNAPMREAAVEYLGDKPRLTIGDGTAEATGLGDRSVDAITAAQAFHWFDQDRSRAEFRRILKPGGWVFLIWNERQSSGSKFLELYEQALTDHAPEYAIVRHRNTPDEDILRWFQNKDASLQHFTNDQQIDLDALLGRAYSSSYVPVAGTPEREAITRELTNIFDQCQVDGKVNMEYETKVYFGQI